VELIAGDLILVTLSGALLHAGPVTGADVAFAARP
jgi:hypothetical protein